MELLNVRFTFEGLKTIGLHRYCEFYFLFISVFSICFVITQLSMKAEVHVLATFVGAKKYSHQYTKILECSVGNDEHYIYTHTRQLC